MLSSQISAKSFQGHHSLSFPFPQNKSVSYRTEAGKFGLQGPKKWIFSMVSLNTSSYLSLFYKILRNMVRTMRALKKHSMQEGPRVKPFLIAIQFLGTYDQIVICSIVIVIGVRTCSSWIYKKSHLRVWMLKLW